MTEEANVASKGIMSSALMVVGVAAILLAGWALKSERQPAPTRPAIQAPHQSAPLPLGGTVPPEPQPSSPPEASPPPVETPPAGHARGPSLARHGTEPLPTSPPEGADPLVARLAARAATDSSRLDRWRGKWTAQLVVACKPETVERLLTAAQGSTNLYVLPATVHDEACFRVCFGAYATSKDAATAADLPASLRGKDKVSAVEIARLLP